MKLPRVAPVMTLPGATLFPQALLPLYIFEPRYRKMLADMLQSHRMFIIAMQRPGRKRDTPCAIGGLGLIRVSVDHRDGTSHLILQGLVRVQLRQTVQYKPYRIQQIRALEPSQANSIVIDALMAKVLELVRNRLKSGDQPFPVPIVPNPDASEPPSSSATQSMSAHDVLHYLESKQDPEQVADLVACTLLESAPARQVILETVNLEQRLKHLIHFLMSESQPRSHDPNA